MDIALSVVDEDGSVIEGKDVIDWIIRVEEKDVDEE